MKTLVWTQIIMAASISGFIVWYLTKKISAWYWKRKFKRLIKKHGPNAVNHL